MKVSRLIQLLQEMPQDSTILVSIDSEGNGYREVTTVDEGYKFYDGDLYLSELTDRDLEAGYTEADLCSHSDAVDAIVLY
jgi:hypothetical protein